MEQVVLIANVCAAGIVDVLSLHKTLKIFVNCNEVLKETFRILASNLGLLLGSVYMFQYIISPGLNHFQKINDSVEKVEEGVSSGFLSFAYHLLWVGPIYVLLYLCSMTWYQNLAELTYRHLHGAPKSISLKVAFSQSLYAVLVWALLYAEVMVVGVVIPSLCESIQASVDSLLFGSLESEALSGAVERGALLSLVHFMALVVLRSVSYTAYAVGCIGSSLLYGWYSFDYYWILNGVSADDRFAMLERYFVYFVGFGLPVTALMRLTSFFEGYGAYLTLFPFLIVLAAVTDYKQPYLAYGGGDNEQYGSATDKNVKLLTATVPLFAAPKRYAVQILRHVDKIIRLDGGAMAGDKQK